MSVAPETPVAATGITWEELPKTLERLGYKDPSHVLRTLFKGSHRLTDADIDVARCLQAGMTNEEIEAALRLTGRGSDAVDRIRERLGGLKKRSGVVLVATLYRLQPWNGKRTTPETPPRWTIDEILGCAVLKDMFTNETSELEEPSARETKRKALIEELQILKAAQELELDGFLSENVTILKHRDQIETLFGIKVRTCTEASDSIGGHTGNTSWEMAIVMTHHTREKWATNSIVQALVLREQNGGKRESNVDDYFFRIKHGLSPSTSPDSTNE